MTASTFAAFWVVSILLTLTPGADWAYVIAAGIRGRGIRLAVAGLLLGHLSLTLLVAAGVGALLASRPTAMTALTFAGAAYLLWLGIGTLRRPPLPSAGTDAQTESSWRGLLRGACVSGLNPKVFLLILALLPQFIDPAAPWPVPLQITALGLMHVFFCGVVYLLVGYSSHAVLRARPLAARWVGRISGTTMIGIGAALLLSPLLHT